LPYFRDNPRDVKRLVNVHRFVKIALQGQGRSVPEEIQRKLVKWLIFCDQWPDLVNDVLGYASKHDKSNNPIADLSTPDSEPAKFASKIGPEDTLTGHDLAPLGQLAQAASISHLVAWKSAERASEDEGSVEPNGNVENLERPQLIDGLRAIWIHAKEWADQALQERGSP
jgi:hypothetical protein